MHLRGPAKFMVDKLAKRRAYEVSRDGAPFASCTARDVRNALGWSGLCVINDGGALRSTVGNLYRRRSS